MTNRAIEALTRLGAGFRLALLRALCQVSLAIGNGCDAAALLIAVGQGSPVVEDARLAYLRARALALRYGCADAAARSAVGLAYLLLTEQSYQKAEELLATEMVQIRRLNDPRLLTETLLKWGVISDKQGKEQRALEYWREAADVARRAGYDFGYSEAITNLGGIAYRARRDDEARTYWLEALALYRRRRDSINIAELDFYLGIIAMRSGGIEEAKFRFSESRALYERNGRPELANKATTYLDYAADMTDR